MVVRIKSRIWADKDGQELIGPGIYSILKAIEETGSIASAARKLGYSYKFVWTYIKRLEDVLGVPLVESKRGGKERGVTELTEVGKILLNYYEYRSREVEEVLKRWEQKFSNLVETLQTAVAEVEKEEEIPYYEEE